MVGVSLWAILPSAKPSIRVILDGRCELSRSKNLFALPFYNQTQVSLFGSCSRSSCCWLAIRLLLEPNRPQVVRQTFSLRRWPQRLDGFTIALISDFHYDPIFSTHPIHKAIPMVMGLNPDLIALTGDFVSVPNFGDDAKGALAAVPCAEILRQLQAPCGVWAILGNHDYHTDAEYVTHALQSPRHSCSRQSFHTDRARRWAFLVSRSEWTL